MNMNLPNQKANKERTGASAVFFELWHRPLIRFCIVVIALFLVAALYGEVIYRYSDWAGVQPAYEKTDLNHQYSPPGSAGHLLGTDNLGRDVAQRVIQGVRIAFHVGIITSLIALPIGIVLGGIAGYFGGKVDSVVVWLYSTVASMPGLLFVLAIALIAGKGLFGIYLGIGLTTWVGVCRLIRAEVIKQRSLPYVQAAQSMGLSSFRILVRHIFPNVAHLVLIIFSIRFPAAVSAEVFISFLGIGVQNEPSLGIMMNNARLRLWQGVWWEMAAVTLVIFLLVLSFNLLGDALRDVLDPRLKIRDS